MRRAADEAVLLSKKLLFNWFCYPVSITFLVQFLSEQGLGLLVAGIEQFCLVVVVSVQQVLPTYEACCLLESVQETSLAEPASA